MRRQLPEDFCVDGSTHSGHNLQLVTTERVCNMKPKVFIGSSREGVLIADAIHANLTYDAECTVWKDGVFLLSGNTLNDLIRTLRDVDFGVFVFSPDDLSIMRGNSNPVVRDNVIFELGLFIGRLGSERSFFLVPDGVSDLRLPSDLAGITPGRYESSRTDGNWMAALNPACMQIKMAMARLKPFQDVDTSPVQPPATPPAASSPRLTLEDYKGACLIKGDTKSVRTELKEFGASWNGSLGGWIIAAKKKDEFITQFEDMLA